MLVLVLLDLGNGQFLRLSWLANKSSLNIIHILASRGEISLSELSHDTVGELLGMVDNTFLFFLFIVFLNNLFFYLFALRAKQWAHGYLVFYTMTGALLSLVMVKSSFDLGFFWGVFNIVSVLAYGYIFLGLKNTPFPPPKQISEQ